MVSLLNFLIFLIHLDFAPIHLHLKTFYAENRIAYWMVDNYKMVVGIEMMGEDIP